MDAKVDQLKEQQELVTNREEQDRVKLLSTFPEEVWSMVLKKVEEPDNLHGLWNTSPFFRNRISQNPGQFLFPQVWPLVRPHFEKAVQSNRVNSQESQDDPTNVPISVEKQVLNLRKVCRTWSNGLDNYYEGSRNELDKIQREGKSSARPWTVENFQNSERLENFLKHFQENHENRNPFLGRNVSLHSNYWASGHEVDLMWNLLGKYGQHIWYCKVGLGVPYPPRLDVYNKLQTILALLPNVKSLQINFGFRYRGIRGKPEMPLLEGYTGPARRMPRMKALTELILISAPELIVGGILMANGGHLESLRIERGMMNFNTSYLALYQVPMPNLKRFQWKIHREQDFVLLEGSEIQWPLKELQVEFQEGLNVQLLRIFKLLEKKWGNTLTDLEIGIARPTEEEDWQLFLMESLTMEMGLPKLRNLHLKLGNCILSLDFLVGMKDSLETLKVEWCQDEDSVFPEEKKVKFWSYQGRVQESDIWKVFPKLERIVTSKFMENGYKITSLATCIYGRKQWEVWMKN